MNTENITEYIRRSTALKYTSKSYKIMIFASLPGYSALIAIGYCLGGFIRTISIIAVIAFLVSAVLCMVLVKKNSHPKFKMIVYPIYSIVLMYLLFLLFSVIYSSLNLPDSKLATYAIPVPLLPLLLMAIFDIELNKPTPFYKEKRRITAASFTIGITGTAAAIRLAFAIISANFGHYVSDKLLETAILCFLLFALYICSTALLDFQRYYYYTKLEKQGLITEDVLKIDDK